LVIPPPVIAACTGDADSNLADRASRTRGVNLSDRFQAIESAGFAGRRAGGHAPRTIGLKQLARK
jgi:hypothetical protein